MKSSLIICFALPILFSCKCDDNNAPTVAKTFSRDDFPVAVGDYWEYKASDLNGGNVDTLLVKVIERLDSMQEDKYLCQLLLDGVITDSSYITVGSDSLVYQSFNHFTTFFDDFKLRFPFNVGDKWFGTTSLIPISVETIINEIVIEGHSFSPAYQLSRNTMQPNFLLNQSFLVSPGVGIIQQQVYESTGFSLVNLKFTLIDYHLN